MTSEPATSIPSRDARTSDASSAPPPGRADAGPPDIAPTGAGQATASRPATPHRDGDGRAGAITAAAPLDDALHPGVTNAPYPVARVHRGPLPKGAAPGLRTGDLPADSDARTGATGDGGAAAAAARGSAARPGFFGEIYETLKSILIGMRITAKYWFSPVVTVRYPYEKLSFAPRFRGIHEFAADQCIACEACARVCPVDCIYIDKSGPRKLDKKTGKVAGGELWRYAIDYEKCMFCSMCTEVCPTECVVMGKNHDISGYTRRDMIVEFAELAKSGLKTPIPLWMERNADRVPWVKAEKERIERGELATKETQFPRL